MDDGWARFVLTLIAVSDGSLGKASLHTTRTFPHDRAGIAWRPAFVTASLHSLWAGVSAGLGVTVRTTVDLPPALMRLDPHHGLPPLPGVELCLHTAPGAASAALTHLRQAVMEQSRVHLGPTDGKDRAVKSGSGSGGP